MTDEDTKDMIRRLEKGELDEVLLASLNEAKKYGMTGRSLGDLRKGVLEDLKEKFQKDKPE